MNKFLFLLSFLVIFGCSKDDDTSSQPEYSHYILPVNEISLPDSFRLNDEIEISFTYKKTISCQVYDSMLYNSQNLLAVIVYKDTDETCNSLSENEGYSQDIFMMKFTEERDYIFNVWISNDENENPIYEEHIVEFIN